MAFGTKTTGLMVAVLGAVLLLPVSAPARTCLVGTAAEHDADAAEMSATLAAIDAACPCASYVPGQRSAYRSCLKTVIAERVGSQALRKGCAGTARRIGRNAVCGSTAVDPLPCIKRRGTRLSCKIKPRVRCIDTSLGSSSTSIEACPTFSRCLEAADTNGDLLIALPGDSGECAGPRCGNGVIEGTEECDDGNPISFDGCSAACQVEPDCNPDGTYVLSTPIEYVCNTTGPGEQPFQHTIDQIALADHGEQVDILFAPGQLPPGPPLSCLAGAPVNRSDAYFTLQECFFVARLTATFTDADTFEGSITLSHEVASGLQCTPNEFFNCPPVTYPITAVR